MIVLFTCSVSSSTLSRKSRTGRPRIFQGCGVLRSKLWGTKKMRVGLDLHQAKKMFFDRASIKNKVDARTRKVLSKFGSHVRQTSRKSIRKRKGTSKPGKPPFSHTGTLKKFIFFGYDTTRRSVVIGPVVVPGKSGKAPSALEHGGKVSLPQGKSTTIEPRPFMGPAFTKELPTAPQMWKDCIK